jgi:dipeptidyl-peptidase-4
MKYESRFLRVTALALLLGLLVTTALPAYAEQAAAQGRKALSVERIYGQPSLSGSLTSGLQWSPDGKLLSYFQRSGQGREAKTDIWVLEVATGQRRVLLDSAKLAELLAPPRRVGASQQTGLGRVMPQRYIWAPNGKALLFVSQGKLYWFDLGKQSAKRLTTGEKAVQDPKISPDSRWVSFVRNHDLWVVEVATGKERQLTAGGREDLLNAELDWVYPEELDIRTAYWWSPDSSQIAYLQMDEQKVTKYPLVNYLSYTGETQTMRYPKAGDANPVVRVGVVGVKGGKTRWMDTGHDTDIYLPRVEWLTDSKQVAIQRLNRAQTKLELLFAEASSGKSQVILTEEDPHWINLHDDLYFFSDGKRFLWSSERDGFRHLYLYDLSGKLLRQITQGRWEVPNVTGIDEKKGAIYFVGTEKSPIERHLYRVAIEGGVSRLTREEGTHSISMSPDTAYYVDTYSNSMTPSRQDLSRADGSHALVINENKVPELAEYGLQPVEFFTVRGADGTELHAMIIKPPDFDPGKKYPVIVNLYGGPHGQVVRNAWGGTNFLWHQMMAQKGYIIFSLDNRGMAGRGHAFETHIHRHMGEQELADQVAGVNYLKSLPYVDGTRVGVWGWSYGGYMTLYAMLNAPDVFKAGFAGAPVTDWRQYDTIYTERYMSRPQDNPEGYKKSSPVSHVAKLKGKLLIAHGTGDDNVHFANTVQFVEELIRAGKYADVRFYPGRGHGIGDPPARLHLFRLVTQFFLDNL